MGSDSHFHDLFAKAAHDVTQEYLVKEAILGRLAGWASRPFGKEVSKKVEKNVRQGLSDASRKAVEFGSKPIPGTPEIVPPTLRKVLRSKAFKKVLSDHPHAIITQLPVFPPGSTAASIATPNLIRKVLGIPKKTGYIDFMRQLKKEVGDTPEVAREKLRKSREKLRSRFPTPNPVGGFR